MAAFISRKQSLLALFAGLCMAAAVVLLLRYFFDGTRLGIHYDFLSSRRAPPPVHRDILLIETDKDAAIESAAIFTLLLTLTEFDASSLVIEVPVPDSTAGRIRDGEEIRLLLDDEYTLLDRNIRNLFEAIRTGSVPPSKSPEYVESLVALAYRGKARLESVLVRPEGADAEMVQQAIEVFKTAGERRVFEARDLYQPSPAGSEYYSLPAPDYDGVIRRAAPVRHIVYRALEPRLGKTDITLTEHGKVLSAGGFYFPLDDNENILFEKPRDHFRGMDIGLFNAYTESDRAMRRRLGDAESLGIFSRLKPERIPSVLYDYAAALRNDLLSAPADGKRAAWIHARAEYFAALDELLDSSVESSLVNAYEELIATEGLPEEGIDKLRALRDELILFFAAMREKRGELREYRTALATALDASFCILGTAGSPVTETSALLANTLLTGRSITPGTDSYTVIWPLLAVLIMLTAIHFLRPVQLLFAGSAASALCAIIFGWSFVVSGYWIDPLVSLTACMAGTLVMFCACFIIRRRGIRRFRSAYAPAVSKTYLRKLLRAGQPGLSETMIACAAVVAVKNFKSRDKYDKDDPAAAAAKFEEFRIRAVKEFLKAGAVYIGGESGAVLFCFGSPPERVCLRQSEKNQQSAAKAGTHPAQKAADLVSALVANGESAWRYGIDSGKCAFYWSERTGYTAYGSPLSRARQLASLAPRYGARALIGSAAREKTRNLPMRGIYIEDESRAGDKESFFELLCGITP